MIGGFLVMMIRIPDNVYLALLYYVIYLIIRFIKYTNIIDEETKHLFYFNSIYFSSIFILMEKFGFKEYYVYAVISWFFFGYILLLLFGNVKYAPLIFLLVVFYSEFYEIPIYIYRYISNTNSIPYKLIMIKLISIIFIEYEFNNLIKGFDFIRKMIKFVIPYSVFGYVIINVFNSHGYQSVIILKFICLCHIIYLVKKHESSKNLLGLVSI